MKKDKKYSFIYLTKEGDELHREVRECYSIKEARQLASELLANSMDNDLKQIKVKRYGLTPTTKR